MKITLEIDLTKDEIKAAYKKYFGDEKPSQKKINFWLSGFIEAPIVKINNSEY